MEELQVIETTSGRQFKPWATKDDVQDPASVTAIASEIASGKQAIAAAINANGGTAQSDESFTELAQNISTIPVRGAGYNIGGVIFQNPITYVTTNDLVDNFTNGNPTNPIIEVIDNTTVYNTTQFPNFRKLAKVTMSELLSITVSFFEGCSVKMLFLPKLQSISVAYGISSNPMLEEIYAPNLSILSANQSISQNSSLSKLTLGKITYIIDGNLFYLCYKLSNIILGEDTDINLNFSRLGNTTTWDGNIDATEWNTNFVNGIVNKLHDYSGGTAHTITLGTYAKAKLTAETIALTNAKGWTIA
jgi:hypothetical protein